MAETTILWDHSDENFIISTRDYAFTEDPIKQTPFVQYQIDQLGRFIRYHPQNGQYHDTIFCTESYGYCGEEYGQVKNNTREGKWVRIGTVNSSYLEIEYKNGVPTGVWRDYFLEMDYDKENKPIHSTIRKGKLLSTYTYEDGKRVKCEE